MNRLSSQLGIAPVVLLLIGALTFGGAGSIVVIGKSKPGDPLFTIDKRLESLRLNFAASDVDKAELRLKIARERLNELETLSAGEKVDLAVFETQTAIENATNSLSNLEIKFKENKITLQSSDLASLLTELRNILTLHQGLVRKVEVKIKDGQAKAKIKLFEQEAKAVEDDLEDVEDDGNLNASTAESIEVEVKGVLVKTGSVFQITSGGRNFTLTAASGHDLNSFVGKTVELAGFGQSRAPTNLTVTRVEIEDAVEDEEEEIEVQDSAFPEVEAKGVVRASGSGFVLVSAEKALYVLSGSNLSGFVGKFVEVEGRLSNNVLKVEEVEVKKLDANGKPESPALKSSGSSSGSSSSSGTEKSGSLESSGSNSSGKSGGDEDSNDDREDDDED